MVCERCGGERFRNKGPRRQKRRYRCLDCGKQMSVPLSAPLENVVEHQHNYDDGAVRPKPPIVNPETTRRFNAGVYNELVLNGVGNVLVFSCTHLPFEHPDYLKFLKQMYDLYECKVVVCLGDFIDHHAVSMHDKDPDGHSAGREVSLVIDKVQQWADVFSEMYITVGNHDALPERQAYKNGVSKIMIKTINEIYEMPQTWRWYDRIVIDGVVYLHGTGRSGKYAAQQWMEANKRSTIIGHVHSNLSVTYSTTPYDRFYAMSVGCGIRPSSFAFTYNKNFAVRPVLGCGVVLANGQQPIPIPMFLH